MRITIGVDHAGFMPGSRLIGVELTTPLCITFLKARFAAEERHQRRLAKPLSIEQRYAASVAAREKEP
jgi:ribose 5-phosphate isomerase RpiB